MLTAGPEDEPMLLQNGANAQQPSAQRLMLGNGQNPYQMQAHSDATIAQYNQAQIQRQNTLIMQ